MIQVINGKSTPSTVRWSTAELARRAGQYGSVLDVGCGDGRLLRRVTSRVRIGIDACQAALEVAVGHDPGGTYVKADLRDYLWGEAKLPPVECVVGVDVVEHFEKKDAWQLLSRCEQAASKCLMWFVPVGNHPQTKDDRGYGNDYFQTHRSMWYPHEMDALGYEVWYYPNWHERIDPCKEKGAMWCQKLLE